MKPVKQAAIGDTLVLNAARCSDTARVLVGYLGE